MKTLTLKDKIIEILADYKEDGPYDIDNDSLEEILTCVSDTVEEIIGERENVDEKDISLDELKRRIIINGLIAEQRQRKEQLLFKT